MKIQHLNCYNNYFIYYKNSETNCKLIIKVYNVYTSLRTTQECMRKLREVLVFDDASKAVFIH